jgi:hypothetical protein
MDPAIEQDFRPPPQPKLPGSVFVAIMIHVLLIAAVAWGIDWNRGTLREIAAAKPEQTASVQSAVSSSRTKQDHAASAGKESSLTVAQSPIACPLRPLLAVADRNDGQFFPPASVSGKTDKDIDALLVAGKEAAAAGNVRDAEVAYLTACRVADALKGAGSIESANARYQLARHYVAVASAASAAPVAERAEIFGQAQAFYADSLQRFRARWGDSHEKTRSAAEGLETARVALSQATQPAGGLNAAARLGMGAGPGSPSAAPERQSLPERPRQVAAQIPGGGKNVKAQNSVAASAPQRTASAKPSFDCRRARSFAEKAICSDAELARLDRDLGRLHARAKQAADNPAAFRRQNDAEWRRRENTCRDRSCLLRWYADRRRQLTESVSQTSLRTDRTARQVKRREPGNGRRAIAVRQHL